MGDYFLLQDRI